MFDCGVHPAHSGMSCLPYFDHINPAEAPVESLKACEIRSYPPAVVEGISIYSVIDPYYLLLRHTIESMLICIWHMFTFVCMVSCPMDCVFEMVLLFCTNGQ